jgi:hypothetical protein
LLLVFFYVCLFCRRFLPSLLLVWLRLGILVQRGGRHGGGYGRRAEARAARSPREVGVARRPAAPGDGSRNNPAMSCCVLHFLRSADSCAQSVRRHRLKPPPPPTTPPPPTQSIRGCFLCC